MQTHLPNFCEVVRGRIHFPRSRKTIPLHEIIMLQGEVNYTLIHTKCGRKLLIPRTLKIFEGLLEGYNFLRTHRGFLINCDHLLRVDILYESVYLTNNLRASIARRRKVEVSRRLELQA
jgi:DNA-binding LytR/AlgR family response regulator